jgi:hypothetical protein
MPSDARLNRIMPALSARERAVAVVAAWKEGRTEDHWLRRTVPENQQREFGRLIGLVRGVNGRLAWLILVYQEEVRRHWMTLGWIGTIKAWGFNTITLSHAILAQHIELVTDSEAAKRRAAARAETLRFREAAEYLTERVADEDESFDDDDTRFENEVRRQERRLRAAAKSGELTVAKGQIAMGSLWNWLGEETPLYPEWGMKVQLVPDDRAEDVATQRLWTARIQKALADAPITFAESNEVTPESSHSNQVGEALFRSLVAGVASTWHGLRTVVLCIDEATEQLGDDPMHPECREALDALSSDMEVLVKVIGDHLGKIELPEPDEHDLQQLRKVLTLAAEE